MPCSRWLLYAAFGGCLAAVLLSAPVLGQDAIEPQDGPAQSQEGGNPDQAHRAAESSENAPVASTPATAQQPSSSQADDRQRAEEYQEPVYPAFQWDGLVTTRDTSAQWLMAFFGVIATVISAIAVYLIKKTLDATRDAVDQAEQATAVTRQAFEETRLSNERQLRAYMSLTPAGLRYRPNSGQFIVSVEQGNSGQTPAQNVRFSGSFQMLPYPLAADYPLPEFPRTQGVNVVAPGHKFRVPFMSKEFFMGGNAIAAMADEGVALYFVGRLDYDDGFARGRVTHVCWSYSPAELNHVRSIFQSRARSNEGDMITPIQAEFTYSDEHNHAT